MILDDPVEEWPRMDVLLAWHSTGFALDKAVKYQNLSNCVVLNDLEMQKFLWDRRTVSFLRG